jgi:hypothetical protein
MYKLLSAIHLMILTRYGFSSGAVRSAVNGMSLPVCSSGASVSSPDATKKQAFV